MNPTNWTYFGTAGQVCEWSLTASNSHANPFREVELDVVLTDSAGAVWRVPAFWSGGSDWRVRFAPPQSGRYEWVSICSDTSDQCLHGVSGALNVSESDGRRRAAGIRVAADGRHFETEGGEPFFWLADTWWMSLTGRLGWPEDFQALAADRTSKGFNVVQIVAGLYPDMDWCDPRGANEAGLPYDKAFENINPGYFDMADLRIRYLVDVGLTPCIVGSWGYFFKWMGIDAVKRHWRYLVARWGAYPVVWCVAGEGAMPYYLSDTKQRDAEEQRDGWTEACRFLHSIDPMHRVVTIHPTETGRDQVRDASVLDFDMLQTGHNGPLSLPSSINKVRQSLAREPAMPVLVAEVSYEGFLHGITDELQRQIFWGSVLSGAAGHTYGANGIWQVNTSEQPYGPSPHGNNWGNRPWNEAMRLPGSGQLGMGKALLERFRWWLFESHQEWVSPCAGEQDYLNPYAAGIPGEVRVIYLPRFIWDLNLLVCGIEPDVRYSASYINPSTGQEHALGNVEPDPDGSWRAPREPELRDWLLVLVRD